MTRALLIALALIAGPAVADTNVTGLYPLAMPQSTVAALPACSAATKGVSYLVTDALTPVALATVVGGGAVVVSSTCNGTNWIVT